MCILGVAFEQVCIGLRTGDCDDDVKQAIADKIIDLSKSGERNPDLLCERARSRILRVDGVEPSGLHRRQQDAMQTAGVVAAAVLLALADSEERLAGICSPEQASNHAPVKPH